MRLLAALVLTGWTLAAAAEQAVRSGDFVAHYAAMPSTDLAPAVARAFGITRSGRRGVIVLNAQRQDGTKLVPVPATARGSARNLLGQVAELEWRQVREGDVHYTIAEFSVSDREWLSFDIQAVPDGAPGPIAIRFRQQFYPDD